MIFSTKNIVIGVVAVISLVFIFDVLRFYLLVRKSGVLVKKSEVFERTLPNAKMNILVLGDSTAVGTGAENNTLSTAGRLGALYPEANIKNLAQNGLKLKGLIKIMERMDSKEYFDIILVQIGANDIIRLTSMNDIETDAGKIFTQLSKQTGKLIVLHSGNIGEASLFPLYVRPILSARSLKMREIYKKLADNRGAKYIDLIGSDAGALLKNDASKYYAEDSLHLNGAGYGLWFNEIKKALNS